MKIEALHGKKILLVGYGIEGKATEAFLKKIVPDAKIHIADKKQGDDYLSHQKDYDIAIKSPHVQPDLLTIPYTTATNLFFGNVNGIVIGISGTKGKTTTASLTYAILKQAGKKVHLVGNIGTPMLSELLISNTPEDVWVCELSSYQLLDITYSPHISVLVSLFPEHMDFHGSVEKYYEAKKHLILYATEHAFYIYNPRFSLLKEFASHTKAKSLEYVEKLPFPDETAQLIGEHNKDNIKAAVTVATLLGVSEKDIKTAVANFQAVRHRLQYVGTYKGIAFYDDAISTTPESTLAALKALPSVKTVFLGGQDRGYDFTPLVDELALRKIPAIVLFPESGKKIGSLLQKEHAYTPLVLETSSMEEAVKFAYQHTPKEGICLLSTASPSYSLWKGFEEKGDLFQKLVKEYSHK